MIVADHPFVARSLGSDCGKQCFGVDLEPTARLIGDIYRRFGAQNRSVIAKQQSARLDFGGFCLMGKDARLGLS
jgi:hypothetical protein